MRKLKAISVLTIFFGFAAITSAQGANPKAGALCLKVNATASNGAHSYKCLKSGKKIIWVEVGNVAKKKAHPLAAPNVSYSGNSISSPEPKSTPSPRPVSPTPSASPTRLAIFDSSLLWQRAAQQVFTYEESRSSSKLTLKIIQSPDFTSSSFSHTMELALQYSLSYWQGLSPKSAEISLVEVNENDVAWATQQLSALGAGAYDSFLFKNGQWNINGQSYSEGQALEEYLPSTSGVPTFILFVGSQSHAINKLGLLTQSYHNAAHGIMFLNEETNYVTNQPSCWFAEGHPSFYGFALSMGNEQVSMSSIRAAQFQNTRSLGFIPPATSADWLAFLKANENRGEAGCFKYALGYSIGTAMVERLVLDFAPLKVNGWILAQGIAAGEWKNTFQSAFGISVDDWYANSAVPYLMKTFEATNFEANG
jgi:hypothetical protein